MPGTYFGPFNEQYSDYANSGNANLGRWPLGHTLILPDGREYKFTLNDGTVEIAGNLYQSVVALSGHTNRAVTTAAAIGATSVTASINTTVAGTDIYAEGMVHTNDATGEGYSYRIRRAMAAGTAHASAASTATLTVNLESGEKIQVALDTTSEVTFTRNRYHAALITAAPPTSTLTGVSPGVAAANRFYWSQVRGYAAVLSNLTIYAGLPVQASIDVAGAVENVKRRLQITTTGSVLTAGTAYRAEIVDGAGAATGLFGAVSISTTTVFDATGGIATNSPQVGMCVKANASTEQALIDLRII